TAISAFEIVPSAVYDITKDGLDALLADPGVASVTLDGELHAQLDSSTGVIDSDLLNAAGVLGNNYEGNTNGGAYQVVIVDSGVDNGHSAFSGRIVSQACYVTDFSCPGGVNFSTAAGSGDACTHSTDCDHGTHVAGIAAGSTFTGGHEGVARGVGIVAIKVAQDDPSSPFWTSAFSAVDNALAQAYVLKTSTNPNIVAVNLSLGTDVTYIPGDTACNAVDPNTDFLMGLLQGVGVAVVVAAGNGGATGGLSFPGCLANSFAVGATNDADVPASFTNSSAALRWWAPGVNITAPVPTGNNKGTKQGTSMAAPHVAGAFALLRECVDGNGVPITNAVAAARLDATGTNVTRSGVTRKRINVLEAATSGVNNNDFAAPELFTGNGPFNDFDFNVCADSETGEPGPFSLDNSVWWTWTPATTGTATVSTEDNGTTVTTFDTQLMVYTGTSLASLRLVASDDDAGTGLRSLVSFPVNGGMTYRIKIDGFAASNGILNLHVENGPPPTCFGAPATIVGSAFDDVINGTAGDDVIVAGAGADTINGLGGNDQICGDAGDDTIDTGDGDDLVLGGSGADTIKGGNGNDVLVGNPGGGSTDDGNDNIHGGPGDDFIDGWSADDVLAGGPGNDQLRGEAGIDTVSYSSSMVGVVADLVTSIGTGEGNDSFVFVENLTGSPFADALTGDDQPNRLRGGGGKDTLKGAGGDDKLSGQSGADTMSGGAGNDTLSGSTGNDKMSGGDGHDTLGGQSGADAMSGGAGNDTLSGSTGADTMSGGNGHDTLSGHSGNDKLSGGSGKDKLAGGTGRDTCNGGSGKDTSSGCETRRRIP
ncbi:MAG: S8 family serine peptidase, partial [Actinomycetota bacterium]|nr:S8 family serine peptidase [Actinomycetota bacterium]